MKIYKFKFKSISNIVLVVRRHPFYCSSGSDECLNTLITFFKSLNSFLEATTSFLKFSKINMQVERKMGVIILVALD